MPALAARAANVRRSPTLTKDSTDPEILNFFLGVHANPGPIADISYRTGGIWQGLHGYQPIRCDRDATLTDLDHVSHWSKLPNVLGIGSVSVVVGDPIFVDDARGIWRQQYGGGVEDDDDVATKLRQILAVSRQLLIPTGALILKIGDQVHNQTRLWQPDLARDLALADDWYPCDRFVIDGANVPQPRRRKIEHAPSQVHWLVFHPRGSKCPGPGLLLPKRMLCAECGRVVAVERERHPTYCREPRTCRQLAYDRRVARAARVLSRGR